MNLIHWKCVNCGKNFFVNASEKDVECPDCDGYDDALDDEEGEYIITMVGEAAASYSAPKPEFDLDENVLTGVREPKIDFPYGVCKICEIPLTEEYEHVSFCGDCAEDTWQVLMSGNKGEGNLPN